MEFNHCIGNIPRAITTRSHTNHPSKTPQSPSWDRMIFLPQPRAQVKHPFNRLTVRHNTRARRAPMLYIQAHVASVNFSAPTLANWAQDDRFHPKTPVVVSSHSRCTSPMPEGRWLRLSFPDLAELSSLMRHWASCQVEGMVRVGQSRIWAAIVSLRSGRLLCTCVEQKTSMGRWEARTA